MGFMDNVDLSTDPPIFGFTQSQPRPGSLTVLGTPDNQPLLSHWFVGMGQVATLTTATTSRWADSWRTGASFRRLFGQMAWEMLRQQSEDNLEMHVENVSGRADVRRVSIVAPNSDGEHAPILTISRGRQQGVSLAVHPGAPGVWVANVALGTGFVVDARMPSSLEPTVAGGSEMPYANELRTFGTDAPMLAAIANAGGGRVISRLDEAFENVRGERVMRDVRTPLLATALMLYLLGILALRAPTRMWPVNRSRKAHVDPVKDDEPSDPPVATDQEEEPMKEAS
jgi:hypothetical protein